MSILCVCVCVCVCIWYTYESESHSVVSLCDPMDYIVRGILQARILEWVAFPFSKGSSQSRGRTQVSRIIGGFFTNWAMICKYTHTQIHIYTKAYIYPGLPLWLSW